MIEDQNFRVEILEKNPSPRDDSNTFDRGHEPKSNLYPSQGEKECAACLLMIKLYLNDTCSDCLSFFGTVDGSEILHQLRLVVFFIIYKVLYIGIQGGCLGFLNHQHWSVGWLVVGPPGSHSSEFLLAQY